MLRFFSFIVCIAVSCIGTFDVLAQALSRPERQSILSSHNQARHLVGLPSLKWSTSLAKTADSWANTLASESCNLRHASHSERNGYGENLYGSWSSDPRMKTSPRDVTKSWLDESGDYIYDTNSCAEGKVCGHYTQIIWRGTSHLGCAKSQCPLPHGGVAEVWVCRYDPPGNYGGQKPF